PPTFWSHLRLSVVSFSVVLTRLSHLHSAPTRRSSDLSAPCPPDARPGSAGRAAAASARPTRCSAPGTAAHSGGPTRWSPACAARSEEHTSELQSRFDLVCRLLHEKKQEAHQHENDKAK